MSTVFNAESHGSNLQDVTLVIVTYNSAHCLPAMGQALAQFPRIIVVDNGSDDGCATQTPAHLPRGCAKFCVNGQFTWGMSPIFRQHNEHQETRSP